MNHPPLLAFRKTNPALLAALVFINLLGCGNAPTPVEPSQPLKPPDQTGPFLSDEPLWTVEEDPTLEGACFGQSIALGDINGDKRPDLVVAIPQCTMQDDEDSDASDMTRGGLAETTPHFLGSTSDDGRLAIYAGNGSFFSTDPVSAEIDWQNSDPETSGLGLTVFTGNVNGDEFADVLVRSRYGVMVLAGGPDLAKALSTPLFRVPGKTFDRAVLSDVNGDGLDDIASATKDTVSIYLATPKGALGPFTKSRTLDAYTVYRMGDTNGDGADDLVVETDTESELYLGCGPTSALACDGGVTSQPAWTVSRNVLGAVSDQNGDGFAEIFLGEPYPNIDAEGRVWLHLSDAETGGPSPTPSWSALGDPMFPAFGASVFQPGDINNDGERNEVVIGSAGRIYAFFPAEKGLQDLRPAWAWPRSDSASEQFLQVLLPVVAASDLNGDHFDDLVIGSPPEIGSPRLGKIMVFGGGKIPSSSSEAPPYLPPAAACSPGSGGLPDMTIDGDVLTRSLLIEEDEFTADSCEIAEQCVQGTGTRRLLRFSVSIENLGPGPLLLPSPEDAPDLFYYDACHDHYHFKDFASYDLLDADGKKAAAGRKQGFYMEDVSPLCMDASPSADYEPSTGISANWADIYTSELPCQWVDITDVPDGSYTLRVVVDEKDILPEKDVLPNVVEVKIRIEGDVVTVLP